MDKIQKTNLNLLDYKILWELDNNSRQPFSKIAKKLKTSQQVINYRVNRLVELGVITSFMTVFSTLSIGLPLVGKVYLQLTGITAPQEKEIYSYLLKHKHINWVARTLGKFDLFCAVMIDNMQTFAQFKEELFAKYGNHINEYEISFIEKAYTLPRNFLINKKPEIIKPLEIKKPSQITLSNTEKKILKLIVDNSRITSLEIAKKLHVNVKTIVAKLKSFQKQGIIQGYRININRQKLNLSYYKVFISLKSYNPTNIEKLRRYCLTQDYVIHFIENIGKYEIELEIEMPTSEEMQKFVRDLRNVHHDTIETIETIEILEELKLSWLPNGF